MDQLGRLETKIDRVLEKLSEHGEMLARHSELHNRNSDSLDEHIKRSNLLEQKLSRHEEEVGAKLEEALLPIKSIKWLGKILAALLVIASLIATTLKIQGALPW